MNAETHETDLLIPAVKQLNEINKKPQSWFINTSLPKYA